VTVYLRAVSVQNGRVLKTVRTTKTIISQKLDTGIFRFVEVQRLLESEAGYSANEPPVLAVTAAIEEAVRAMIIEGTRDGLWQLADNASPEAREMFASYDAQRVSDGQRDVYDRLQLEPQGRLSVQLSGGASRIEDDFTGTSPYPTGSLALRYRVAGPVEIGAEGHAGRVDVRTDPETFGAGDLHLRLAPYAQARVRPYASVGVGFINVPSFPSERDTKTYVTGTAGVEIRALRDVGLTLDVVNLYPLREGLDGFNGGGAVNDNLWSIRAGVSFYGLGL
jgi:curli production assembly/transport component CsgG